LCALEAVQQVVAKRFVEVERDTRNDLIQ
jgi:hypothetical protein